MSTWTSCSPCWPRRCSPPSAPGSAPATPPPPPTPSSGASSTAPEPSASTATRSPSASTAAPTHPSCARPASPPTPPSPGGTASTCTSNSAKPGSKKLHGNPRWPARRGRPFPGAAKVGGQAACQAQLGVAGADQPGPPVRGLRVAELGDGPPQDLLEQPKRVLKEQAVLHT